MHIKAWIDRIDDHVEAGFVAAAEAGSRASATQIFEDESDARAWVEREAEEIAAPIEWIA
jgi:hypothetical protein